MDDGLVQAIVEGMKYAVSLVLILVVVDDGLVQFKKLAESANVKSLNPCCSGRWSSTWSQCRRMVSNVLVLILVVVDDGLVQG